MLGEYNDEWMVTRRYISMGAMEEAQAPASGQGSMGKLDAEKEKVLVVQIAV